MEELIEAIENDNIVTLKKLCKAGIDLNQPINAGLEYGLEDPDYMPILFFAIRKHTSIEFIEVLLENGLDFHQTDEDGLSAIDIAIKFKRLDMVKYCIDKGVDINTTKRPSGIKPITLAACFNNTEIVQLLLDNGAEINSEDKMGMSAKDYAKKLGQKKMLVYLDERGAKFNRYAQDTKVESLKEQGNMKNRQAPTDDMGFDSI